MCQTLQTGQLAGLRQVAVQMARVEGEMRVELPEHRRTDRKTGDDAPLHEQKTGDAVPAGGNHRLARNVAGA